MLKHLLGKFKLYVRSKTVQFIVVKERQCQTKQKRDQQKKLKRFWIQQHIYVHIQTRLNLGASSRKKCFITVVHRHVEFIASSLGVSTLPT